MDAGKPRILKRGTAEAEALAAGPGALLAAARVEAEAIRAEAERAAEERIREAAGECARLRAEAVEAGRGEARAEAAVALARGVGERERAVRALEPLALELGLEVARRILRREVEGSTEVFRELASGALRAAAGRGAVNLRAAPVDLPALEREADSLRALLSGAPLAFVPDAGLGPGDLVLELEGGRIDARIEAQLEPFRRALAGGAG